MEQLQLFTKINYLPADLKSELNDFIDFLLSKSNKRNNKKQPKFGSGKGKIYVSSDFDEPLDDFKEYMR
jgi:hypothetical protein